MDINTITLGQGTEHPERICYILDIAVKRRELGKPPITPSQFNDYYDMPVYLLNTELRNLVEDKEYRT